MGFPDGSAGKDSACNAGVTDSVPRSGRFPGGGDGNLLQYSCLENPMDGGKGHKEWDTPEWLSVHTQQWAIPKWVRFLY